MNPNLDNFGSNDSEQDTQKTQWDDMIEDLNKKHPDVSRDAMMPVRGDVAGMKKASKGIKEEESDYRKIGDKLFPKLTESAKEANKIRDGKDLGEMLHEKAMWDNQVEKGVSDAEALVSYWDEHLQWFFSTNWWNLDGSRTDAGVTYDNNYPSLDSLEQRWERFFDGVGHQLSLRGTQLLSRGENTTDANNEPVDRSYLRALVYLAAGIDAPEISAVGHTEEELRDSVVSQYMKKFLSDDDAFKQLKESPTYAVIERVVKMWNENRDGKYEPISWDFRETPLYQDVDKILSDAMNISSDGE